MTGRTAGVAGEVAAALTVTAAAALRDGSATVNGTTAGTRSWRWQPAATKGTGNPAAAAGPAVGGVSARNPHPPGDGTSTSADGCRWPGAGAAAAGRRGSAWRG